MPKWRLYYHFVWTTKHREPVIVAGAEPEIHGLIAGKVEGLEGHLLALNGTADHVHLVATVPPKLSLASFVGQVKGATSARYNQAHPTAPLYWQDEYGVFSCDRHCLPRYIDYVERQKEHHAAGELRPLLESAEH